MRKKIIINPRVFSIVRCALVFNTRLVHSCLFDETRQKLQRLLNYLVHTQIIISLCACEGLTEVTIFYKNIVKKGNICMI